MSTVLPEIKIEIFALGDEPLETEAGIGLETESGESLEIEGGWADVTSDVRVSDQLRIKYGTWGNMPTDRVARTGTFKFGLNNSVSNSAGLNGYYTYNHNNCRSGFKLGVDVRATFTYLGTPYVKHLGRLAIADPTPGIRGKRNVDCMSHDWMAEALRTKCKRMPIVEDIKTETALAMLVALARHQPNATSYASGQETFEIFPDMAVDERTTILRVIHDLMMSEFGYAYVTGPGTFTFQDRHARTNDSVVNITIDESLLFDVTPRYRQDDLLDKVKAVVYPRDVGAEDETLYSLTTAFQILAGETKTIVARYSDPSNRDSRLSALTLQDLEGKNQLVEQEDVSARGFEVDAGGWVAGTMVSAARSTDRAKIGIASLLATTGVGGANNYRTESELLTGFVQNDVVYVQAYVYIPDVWPIDLAIMIEEYDDGDNVGSLSDPIDTHNKDLDDGWYRLSGSTTLIDGDCAKVKLIIGSSQSGDFSGGAVTVYIDECYVIHDSELNFDFATGTEGGGDLNNDLELIDSTQGGNSTEFVLKNVGSGPGYVAGLDVDGRAIRVYDPITVEAYDEAVGSDREIELRLKYQGSHFVGKDFADSTLNRFSVERVRPFVLGFHASKSSDALIHALEMEPGRRIALTESMIGMDAAQYFIQGVELVVEPASNGEVIIDCYWALSPAETDFYWMLGTSELGIDNYLGS